MISQNQMKKILIFSLAYYPRYVSGAEAAIKEITDRISDIEFHMVTLRFDSVDPVHERIGNVEVYRIGSSSYLSKMLFPFRAAFFARRLHQKIQFDSMWAMMTYMVMPAALSRFLGVRVPYVLTLQDGDPYEKVFGRLRVKPFLPLINWGFRRATVIQVISSFLGTWPGKRGYRGPIELIYNGANPKNLAEDYSKDEALAIRNRLGKKPSDVYLLNVSRLVHQKANDITIKALKLLPSNVLLVLVGEGEDEVMLKTLAEKEGVTNRVKFIGRVDRSEVAKYRNTIVADIFVCPSRSEGLQMSSLSAMAGRLPVVATQEGGLAEYIFDEKRNPGTPTTAWAVDADSPEQIAEAVKDIVAHPEKVKEVTERARAMVFKKYNWDNIGKEMREKVFAKVIS